MVPNNGASLPSARARTLTGVGQYAYFGQSRTQIVVQIAGDARTFRFDGMLALNPFAFARHVLKLIGLLLHQTFN